MPRGLVVGEGFPRFLWLLGAMLLELLLAPVLAATPMGFALARVTTGVVLTAALFVVGFRRTPAILFVLAFSTHCMRTVFQDPVFDAISLALRLGFFVYVLGLILLRVLRDQNVTYDTIAGASCGYVLLGLVWADLFILLQTFRPDSYDVPSSMLVDGDPRAALVYFSFVTLTTVGYGFVHPNDPGSGGLAVSEAIFGQLYLAIMVSRLVGLHIADRSR